MLQRNGVAAIEQTKTRMVRGFVRKKEIQEKSPYGWYLPSFSGIGGYYGSTDLLVDGTLFTTTRDIGESRLEPGFDYIKRQKLGFEKALAELDAGNWTADHWKAQWSAIDTEKRDLKALLLEYVAKYLSNR